MITEEPVEDPLNLHVIKERGSRLTCSYEEEKRAMSLAVGWLKANQTMNKGPSAQIACHSSRQCKTSRYAPELSATSFTTLAKI